MTFEGKTLRRSNAYRAISPHGGRVSVCSDQETEIATGNAFLRNQRSPRLAEWEKSSVSPSKASGAGGGWVDQIAEGEEDDETTTERGASATEDDESMLSGGEDRGGGGGMMGGSQGAGVVSCMECRTVDLLLRLILTGIFGIVGGFLGSVFVVSSCHYATVHFENAGNVDLHYGMWKFSPMKSAYSGYGYCSGYDDKNTSHAAIFSRVVGLTALVLGTTALCILWAYVLVDRATEGTWKWAVHGMQLAGICQFLTLFFFSGALCQKDNCGLGPGAVANIAVSFVWLLVGYEMVHSSPFKAQDQSHGLDMEEYIVPSSFKLSPRVQSLLDYCYMRRIYDNCMDKRNSRGLPSLSNAPHHSGGYIPPQTVTNNDGDSVSNYHQSDGTWA